MQLILVFWLLVKILIGIITFFRRIIVFNLTQIYCDFLLFLDGISINFSNKHVQKLTLRLVAQTKIFLRLIQGLTKLASTFIIILISGKRSLGFFCLIVLLVSRLFASYWLIASETMKVAIFGKQK